MSNEQIVSRIQDGEDTAANMERLWTQNQAFVAKMAWKYQAYAEFDDLMQEGYLGLCRAVEGYDLGAGSSFIHYAAYWIKRAMISYIYSNGAIRIPVNLHSHISHYEKFKSSFLSEYGREPDNDEISHHLGISRKSVQGLKKAAEMQQIESIERSIEGTEGLTLKDCIPGHEKVEEDVLEAVQQEQLKAVLWPMVDDLQEDHKKVLYGIYQEKRTMKNISEELGCCYQRVPQMHREGLRELRKSSNRKKLLPFIQDYIDTHAYHGSAENFHHTWTSSTERTAAGLIERWERWKGAGKVSPWVGDSLQRESTGGGINISNSDKNLT